MKKTQPIWIPAIVMVFILLQLSFFICCSLLQGFRKVFPPSNFEIGQSKESTRGFLCAGFWTGDGYYTPSIIVLLLLFIVAGFLQNDFRLGTSKPGTRSNQLEVFCVQLYGLLFPHTAYALEFIVYVSRHYVSYSFFFLHLCFDVGVVLTFGGQLPVVKVGRMAGQFAKPRSDSFEERDGVKLPSYKGDNVNGDAFDEKIRIPDPQRMITAYCQAAATLNLLRAFATGDYAALQRVSQWNPDFVEHSEQGDR